MSVFSREADGSPVRYIYNAEGLTKLSSISYDFNEFELANNVNEDNIKDMNKLFKLNKKYINKMINNTLFPVYYMIEFDSNCSDFEPIDFIKFEEYELNQNLIENKIDLQLFNNIIFMIGNSKEFSTFFRNVWNKVIDIYNILSFDNYRVLKKILNIRYKYNSKEIEDYCNNFDQYIYNFYKNKIENNMTSDKCYYCFCYYKSLLRTLIPKKYYNDLSNKFNSFIIECLNNRIDEIIKSKYCENIFDGIFFAREILQLDNLDSKNIDIIREKLFEYYYKCLNVMINKNEYEKANEWYQKVCFENVFFTNYQMNKFNEIKDIIDKNYNKDSNVIKRKKEKIKNITSEIFALICLITILIIVVSLILTLIYGFKVILWNYLLVGSIIAFIIDILMYYFTDKFMK